MLTAPHAPQFFSVFEVEARHRASLARRLHALDDELARRLGKRSEDAAAVEPAHAAGKDGTPVEVTWLKLGGRLVGPVVEHDRCAHAVTAVAVDRGQVRAVDAVV